MSKKKDEIQSVGQAIRDLLNTYRLSNKYDEATVVGSWERLVGKPIANRTRKVSMRNSVLFVEFDSPAMRQDFLLHKKQVLDIFKKEFGEGVITDIVAM